MKNYDIWFNLAHPANFVIEAKSVEEAKDLAEDLLADMDADELMRRIKDAIDYMGVKVVEVEELIECQKGE